MSKRRTLNEKRLTKKQVQELINSGASLNEEFTRTFEETYVTGVVKRDLYYTLPGDRILLVFDENDLSIPGRGDIYPLEYMKKFAAWRIRLRSDSAHGRFSSVDHWRFYSRHRSDLIQNVGPLVNSLAELLSIEPTQLNSSYASLDLVSSLCMRLELQDVFARCYDPLVAYVGEVIKHRVNGIWTLNTTHSGGEYPFISIGLRNVQYMPINAVWSTLDGIDPIDLRKAAADEVRRVGPRAQYERQYGHLFLGGPKTATET